MSEPKVPCTWCLNGRLKTWVPGGYVALFACVREHMTARPLCANCASDALGRRFLCRECAAAGVDEDSACSQITLVTDRADWMRRIETGRVRMVVR